MCADTRTFKLKARLIIINNYLNMLSLHKSPPPPPPQVLCIYFLVPFFLIMLEVKSLFRFWNSLSLFQCQFLQSGAFKTWHCCQVLAWEILTFQEQNSRMFCVYVLLFEVRGRLFFWPRMDFYSTILHSGDTRHHCHLMVIKSFSSINN